MQKLNRKIVVCVSDMHAGFSLGLCNPETELRGDLKGTIKYPSLTESQKFLWELYTKGISDLKSFAKKDDIIVLSLGDITHGLVHLEEQLSTRMSDQSTIAYYNFLPLLNLKNVTHLRMIIGTGVHVFGEGSSDDIVSLALKNKYPKVNIKTMYHSRLQIGETLIDAAHHGPGTGNRIWTKGDTARQYLKSILMSDLLSGETPPDLVLRGHYHQYIKAWAEINGHEAWLMVLPPLCLMSDFARKASASSYKTSPGLVMMEIINGKIGQKIVVEQAVSLFEKETLQ